MRTISSAAASERVRVMEGNEGVDRPKGKRVWRVGGVGVTFEARCRGKGNMKTTDYDAEWMASGADADARLPREISQ